MDDHKHLVPDSGYGMQYPISSSRIKKLYYAQLTKINQHLHLQSPKLGLQTGQRADVDIITSIFICLAAKN